MSVHCYMKTDRCLVAQEVEQDLKEIIHRKFKDLLRLECRRDENEICDWDLRYDETHGFPVCLKTNGKLEFTHPDDAWGLWIQSIVEQELMKKYNAICFDDEYPNSTNILLQKYRSFEEFLQKTIRNHSLQWKQAIIITELSRLPDELKKIIND